MLWVPELVNDNKLYLGTRVASPTKTTKSLMKMCRPECVVNCGGMYGIWKRSINGLSEPRKKLPIYNAEGNICI